jgi:hypothetical protein
MIYSKEKLSLCLCNHYIISYHIISYHIISYIISCGPFEKFVDWWRCAAVMQREAVTIIPRISGGGNVVMS